MIRAISGRVRTLAVTVTLGVALGVAVPRAWGQAEPAPVPSDLEEGLARSLYERGVDLYKERRHAEALQLFREAVATSPQGPAAAAARRMIERAQARVKTGAGPSDLRGTVDEDVGVDEIETLGEASEDEPMDPYPEAGADNDSLVVPEEGMRRGDRAPPRAGGDAQLSLTLYGGAFGFWEGIALANVIDAAELGVLMALGGAALGMGGTYLGVRDRSITNAQARAVMSGGTWGALDGLFLGWAARDLADTPPETDNGFWAGTLIGGLLGGVAGIGYAVTEPSEGDVAVMNSTTAYGTLGGILVAGAMDPPYTGAYGMNGFLGSLAGIGGGLLLASNLEVSRGRMAIVDLGAAVGALAPWIIIYPIVKQDPNEADTNRDSQITSAVSLITLGLGGGLAWYLTRNYDRKRDLRAERDLVGAPPGLLVRDGRGAWHLGSPALRPLPAAPSSLAVDLLSGTF